MNDFKITIEQADGSDIHEILLTGEFTIDNALSIYNYLINNVLLLDNIRLNLQSPLNIDLCTIQIIIAFMKSRNKSKKSTYLNLDIDDGLSELLDKTGITETITSLQREEK